MTTEEKMKDIQMGFQAKGSLPTQTFLEVRHAFGGGTRDETLIKSAWEAKKREVVHVYGVGVFQGWIQLTFEGGDGGEYWYPGVAE